VLSLYCLSFCTVLLLLLYLSSLSTTQHDW
jgi:hypothetical protein